MAEAARCCLGLLLLGCLASSCFAQFGMPGMGGMEEQKAAAVPSDVKYIKCATCEAMTKQASRQVKSMRESLKPGHKLDESSIIDLLERMCDTSKPEGKWITHYDIVEKGDKLELVHQDEPSKCNSECATIARACSQISDDLDLSDLSEALFAGKSRSVLHQLACYDQSSACKTKAPPVPKDRKPGPAHVPMSEDEARQQQLMSSMKAAGMNGQMFNRDDLKQQLEDLQEQADSGDVRKVLLQDPNDSDEGSSAAGGGGLTEQLSKASKAVGGTVDAATGFLKDKLSQLSSSFKKRASSSAEL